MHKFIKINEKDNVAVAICDTPKGFIAEFSNKSIETIENIEKGHKFALCDIECGEQIIKYGNSIGTAQNFIKKGSHVHIHNMKTSLDEKLEYEYTPNFFEIIKDEPSFFDGYVRENGKVGVRNQIFIIPTVGCVSMVAKEIERQAKSLNIKNADDIIAFSHPYGCSQMGKDEENTKKILCDLINHPNAGGVLVLGLGCENSNISEIKKVLGNYDENRVKFVSAQDYEDEISVSLEKIKELIDYASSFKRQKVSAEHLIIGLKCGGSDGLSGITANKAVGEFSDILISKGGSTILTEVPEMFGAETILMNRCKNEEVFNKTVKLINDFKDYYKRHDQVIYENPSPGNKAGGISTLEDKSQGCTQKSGSAKVSDVLEYGEALKENGLNLLSAPGNDLVAATALAASGAQIVLFTTGRGTPFSCPVPTLKISSNTELKNKKNNWIDFDCGRMLLENLDISKELFDFVLKVASGEKVKSEKMGYHDMAIFKTGVTL